MIRRRMTGMALIFVLALAFPLSAADIPTTFSGTHYYILSLGQMSADLNTLVQTAQSSGYTVIRYEGDTATVSRGTQAVDVRPETAVYDESVLVVDGDAFHLRMLGSSYAFTVRPAEEGYQLVVNPSLDLAIDSTLALILTQLQQIGLLGDQVDLEFQSYAKADLKGPAAPAGVFIDSSLYGLVVSEDWFAYAAQKGYTQVGLRVEVVAEKVPGGVLDASFSLYVVEESASLVKLLCPIHQLVALARSSAVGYVRTAYQPSLP